MNRRVKYPVVKNQAFKIEKAERVPVFRSIRTAATTLFQTWLRSQNESVLWYDRWVSEMEKLGITAPTVIPNSRGYAVTFNYDGFHIETNVQLQFVYATRKHEPKKISC